MNPKPQIIEIKQPYMINEILLAIFILLMVLMIIIFSKLFMFVKSLSQKFDDQKEYIENLTNSIKNVIHEGYLKNDGRLAKNVITRTKEEQIYNGINIGATTETEIEI